MSELLPCSHCGGEAELLTFWDFYKFSCKNADCTAHVADAPYVQHAEGTWYGSIDEARAAWNTRAERTCHVEHMPKNKELRMAPWIECSECGGELPVLITANYCPNCGARVVGE